MLQAVATLALTVMVVAEDSPATRDVYGFVPITRKPTKQKKYARADGYYTARPKMFDDQVKGDSYRKYFRRYFTTTKRPTPLKKLNAAGDGYRRPTQRPKYMAASDGYMRPTQRPRYMAAGDGYRRPTQRPKYMAAGDAYRRPTQRPKYMAAGDAYVRPTQRPRYIAADGYVRPTQRPRYMAAGDNSYLRPTQRPRYMVRGDSYTGRPTKKPTKPYMQDDQVVDDVTQVVPDPEVVDHKYFLVKQGAKWSEAQQACAKRGAQLATIHSDDEHLRVARACTGECWINADEEMGEKCARMSADKKVTSADCQEVWPSVCEKMSWNARVEASVGGDYLSRGNFASLLVMATALVVVSIIVANWVCVVDDKKEKVEEREADETTPLLLTRD